MLKFALCEFRAIKVDCSEIVKLDDLRAMSLKYFWLRFLASQTGDSFEKLSQTVFVCNNYLVLGNTYGYDLDQDHKVTALYLGMYQGCERIFALVETTDSNYDEVVDSYLVY